jgi:hypothetical protein
VISIIVFQGGVCIWLLYLFEVAYRLCIAQGVELTTTVSDGVASHQAGIWPVNVLV